MRFLGRAKIRLDAEMQLHGSARKPTSTASREVGGFGDLGHAECVDVKCACPIFLRRRHRELYVVDRRERVGHRLKSLGFSSSRNFLKR